MSSWLWVLPLCVLMSLVVFEQYLATQEQVIQLVCTEMQQTTANITCDSHAVSSTASSWIRWIQMAQGCGSIAVVGLAGSASDHFGRRPVLLCALFGNIFLSMPCLLVECVPALRAVWRPLLVVGWALGGLTGGLSMILLSVFAVVADLVPPARRPTVFTVVEAAIGLGGVCGVAAGGYCMDVVGPRAVFIALLAIQSATFLYTLVFLRESLPAARRIPSLDWRMVVCLYSLAVLLDPALLRPRRSLFPLVAAFLFAYFTVQGLDAVTTSYLAAAPFSWSDSRIGFFTCAGLGARVAGGLLLGPLVERWLHSEQKEIAVIVAALALYGACNALLGVVHVQAGLFALTAGAGLASSLCFGYLRALLSRSAGPRDQGRMLGAVTFIVSAAQALSPLLFSSVYAATVDSSPGLAFVLLGLSSGLAAVLMLLVRARTPQHSLLEASTPEGRPLLAEPLHNGESSVNS